MAGVGEAGEKETGEFMNLICNGNMVYYICLSAVPFFIIAPILFGAILPSGTVDRPSNWIGAFLFL